MTFDFKDLLPILIMVAGFGAMMNNLRLVAKNVNSLMEVVPRIDKEIVAIKVRLDFIEEKIKTVSYECPLLNTARSKKST